MFSLNSKITHKKVSCLAVLTLFVSTASASNLNIPNTFVANQPAVAGQVNTNFNAVKTSVNDNNTRLAALEALVTSMQSTITAQQTTISQLQADLNSVENNTVLELDGYLKLSVIDGYDTAEFEAINIQLNNGTNSTAGTVNGLGNLTVGYNEAVSFAPEFCSDPQYTDSVNCIGNLHTWDNNVHTGSHNFIVGRGNSYTKNASIVSGLVNVSNNDYANVTGGQRNIASGKNSSISGGYSNFTLGVYSSISGGRSNSALGTESSVSGGRENIADGGVSSILGGSENTTNGSGSSISGGESNIAGGSSSHISGGRNNVIPNGAHWSSLSGGNTRSTTGFDDWVAGSLFEDN